MAEAYGKKFTFTWKIKNVSYFTLKDTRHIESPGFIPYGLKEDKLSLLFYPRRIPKYVELSLAGQDEAVLLISNFGTTTDEGILSQVEVLDKDEVVQLKKLQPNEFVLKLNELIEILKNNGGTVTFLCHLQLTEAVEESRIFAEDCAAVTKTEIHREFFKTTMSLRNADERNLSVVSSHFVIFLTVLNGVLKVIIEQNETEKRLRKNRYLCGKFLLVATKSPDTIAFDVKKYFDSDKCGARLTSPNYKIKKGDLDMFYFSCDIKTGGIQTEYLIRSHAEVLRRVQSFEDHLRYVSATNVYPDIVIRVGDTNIAAHKVILASKSSVLATLIENNESCIVEFTDYDLKTVRKFLDFLYSGELSKCDINTLSNLCHMAEAYEIDTLVVKCASFQDKPKPNPSLLAAVMNK